MGRKPSLLVVLATLAAVAATFLTLLLRSSGDASAPRFEGSKLTLIRPVQRKLLPDLAAPALEPPPPMLRLRALAGRPALIDVWASWCVPCREEAPMLARLWRQYRGRIQFLGVDVEDTRGDARRFVRRYRLGYPNIFDERAALAGKLGFYGLPTAFLVDDRGRVAATLVGRQKEATLRAGFAALAREANNHRQRPATDV